MTYQTLSELITLLILTLSSLRIFIIEKERVDQLAIIPSVALIISILNFLAWGISLQEIIVFAISLFAFLANFRALLRLNEKLIIDHYNPSFIIASCISLIALIAASIFIVKFRPAKTDLTKYSVSSKTEYFCGSLENGFHHPINPFERKTLCITKFESDSTISHSFFRKKTNSVSNLPEKNGSVILFIPGECANTTVYEPFLTKLAHDGYCVYSAEFFKQYPKLTKRHHFIFQKMFNKEKYDTWVLNEKTAVFSAMYKSLCETLDLIPKSDIEKNTDFIAVGDDFSKDIYLTLLRDNQKITRCFDISSISEYPTAGYGPVEQTDPFIAYLLGYKRDDSMYTSSRIASVLETMIKATPLPTKTIVVDN